MVTNNPTTTGGRLMPVFTKLMANCRPGKGVSARKVPRGTPMSKLTSEAEVETCSERRVIRQTSGSSESRSQHACFVPLSRSPMSLKEGKRRNGETAKRRRKIPYTALSCRPVFFLFPFPRFPFCPFLRPCFLVEQVCPRLPQELEERAPKVNQDALPYLLARRRF